MNNPAITATTTAPAAAQDAITDDMDELQAQYLREGFTPAMAARMAAYAFVRDEQPRHESWEDRMSRELGIRRWGEI